MEQSRVFGPVPSRRLGRSVGINSIPPKICTYSCVYCQLGRSLNMTVTRRTFYDPEDLFAEVREKIRKAAEHGESIDYLTIVPDGEPTLDLSLGRLIGLLKGTGIAVAVITNASLLGTPEVRKDLDGADWVSVKIDALDEEIWRKIDRPHKGICFEGMLAGIEAFAGGFDGRLVTETMLVKGLNDAPEALAEIAGFVKELHPAAAYLGIPTRPPAEPWVEAPGEETINMAYQVFREQGVSAELLIGYEGNEFAFTGNIEQDILGITAVHPMREDALLAYLEKARGTFAAVETMVKAGELVVSEYRNQRFYLRKPKRIFPMSPGGCG